MVIKLSKVLRIYNNQRMTLSQVLNTPLYHIGEPFDPLIDLLGESYFGTSNLERIEGYAIEVPITREQSLILPTDRDPKTFFKIEKGWHEWIYLPEDAGNRELNLRLYGAEQRVVREYGFIFTQYPENWYYDNDQIIWQTKGKFLLVKSLFTICY